MIVLSHVAPPLHVVAFLYEVAMEYGKDVKDNDFDRIACWIADAWDPDTSTRIQALQKLSAKHIENVRNLCLLYTSPSPRDRG